MGTTLTAIALVGGTDGRDLLALANVGDSRAYVLSGAHIVQITADHSLAEERVRHGEMTEEEAAVHPQRHILTRALGVSSEVESDMWELQLQSGDRIILCSDGLSNEVGMDEMADVLGAQPDPQRAAQELVDLANERGGSDNITVVVVDVLVGEESDTASSVVTPIGERAGAPLVLAAGAVGAATAAAGAVGERPFEDPASALTGVVSASPKTAETAAVSKTDALAPGAQLGFSGPDTQLSKGGPGSGEFLVGQAGTVPLARTSLRVPPKRAPAPPPESETRRARRRRLGVPRRITVRVLLFMVLVAAVPVGAYFAVHWYAYDNWYVALRGDQIVIKQGYPNGVLWFKSKTVDSTGVKTSQVLPASLPGLKAGFQEASLPAAKKYVVTLQAEYKFLHQAAVNSGGANVIGPNGALPTITAPPTTTSSTTTVPGQTTVPAAATTPPTAPPPPPTTAAPATVPAT